MNRLIICTILLVLGQTAFAEQLYRWTEEDGSITFSPTPPPAGVEFETVQSIRPTSEETTKPAPIAEAPVEPEPITSPKPSILATSEHDVQSPRALIAASKRNAQPEPDNAKPKLTYAPELNSGITRSAPEPKTVVAVNDTQQEIQTIGSDKKRQQCEDLSKRVMSLERRMRADLTWEDMDNTVIAMARYQRSYDQHCGA